MQGTVDMRKKESENRAYSLLTKQDMLSQAPLASSLAWKNDLSAMLLLCYWTAESLC